MATQELATASPMTSIATEQTPAHAQIRDTSATSSHPSLSTSIGALREEYGPHFAIGHRSGDTLGQVLGEVGAATFEEYMKQQNHS